MRTSLIMAKFLLKIFTRDRQAIFFVLILPAVMIFIFGTLTTKKPATLGVGVTNYSTSSAAKNFIEQLDARPSIKVIEGSEDDLLVDLKEKHLAVAVTLPKNFPDQASGNEIEVKADSSQQNALALVMPVLREVMNDVERELRGLQPMFKLTLKDIQVRSLRYIDFLLPGLIALSLMNVSIAGSGSNTVEYRRKGILKRLFVTPIKPGEFISGVVIARASLALLTIALSVGVAVYFFNVQIMGNLFAFFLIVVMGLVIFLSIGFTLGSVAKTQQSIQSMVSLITFPQILLSGIFLPIENLPDFLQPIAHVLPLTFVASALREVVTNGLSLVEILPTVMGMLIWLILAFVVSTRSFAWKEVAG